jgi:hypothetical protein
MALMIVTIRKRYRHDFICRPGICKTPDMNAIIEFHIEPEEVAESYVMERMPLDEAALFEVHLAQCPKCMARVEQAFTFAEAMRGAGRKLRESVPF